MDEIAKAFLVCGMGTLLFSSALFVLIIAYKAMMKDE